MNLAEGQALDASLSGPQCSQAFSVVGVFFVFFVFSFLSFFLFLKYLPTVHQMLPGLWLKARKENHTQLNFFSL